MVAGLVHVAVFVAPVALVLCFAGCASQAAGLSSGPLLWHEGENFATATQESEKQSDARPSASSGRLLYGGTLDDQGRVVTWKITLKEDVPEARIIFRYARLHWRDSMVPAAMEVRLTGAAEAKTKLEFPNTGGWGNKPNDWGLAEAKLGTLAKGDYTVTLTSLADNNSISVDGFFVAPAGFKVTADELAALRELQVTSGGYLGLRTAAIIRQDQEPLLWVGAKVFGGSPDGVAATIRKSDGAVVTLQPAGKETLADAGMESYKFTLPKLADGTYTVEIASSKPACKVPAEIILAGDLLGSLDKRIAALEAYLGEIAASKDAGAVALRTDLEHIVEYLKTNRAAMSKTAGASDNPFKEGLAFHEGASATSPVVDNMRRAVEQAEAAVARVKAGQAPYDGVTGELRRSFLSAKDQRRHVYRMFIPSAYAQSPSVPLILFLHGGGGNEDYWPDMEDGRILKTLETRGYLALMPKWHSRNFGTDWTQDMMQLVEMARKEFPKVDPKRIYVTGISMGGFGTYAMTTTFPDYFAAGCCVSGTGRVALAAKLKNVPLLIFQGGADTVVPPAGAKAVTAEMEKLGYTVKLHIFPTWGHGYHVEEYLKLTLDWFDKYHK